MRILFNIACRIEARAHARELGLSRKETRAIIEKMTDEAVEKARKSYGLQVPMEFLSDGSAPVEGMGALGDGSILKAILGWLSSDEGKAFIKFLISLFMLV
jgi:hypothetical protein